jgi:ADP-ribosylglycohydrolase
LRFPAVVLFADDVPLLVEIYRCATRVTHTDPKAECGALAIALAACWSIEQQGLDQFISDLARQSASVIESGKPEPSYPLSIVGLVPGNIGFVILVLTLGFRRMLPQY